MIVQLSTNHARHRVTLLLCAMLLSLHQTFSGRSDSVIISPLGGVRSIVIGVSVCLSVHLCIPKTTRPNFTKFFDYDLWMTLCFHIMGQLQIQAWILRQQIIRRDSPGGAANLCPGDEVYYCRFPCSICVAFVDWWYILMSCYCVCADGCMLL